MTAAGAEAGLVTGVLQSGVTPNGDWTDIPMAGLGGMVFGGAIGGLTKHDLLANVRMAEIRKGVTKSLEDTNFDPVAKYAPAEGMAVTNYIEEARKLNEAEGAALSKTTDSTVQTNPDGSSMDLGAALNPNSKLGVAEHNIRNNIDPSFRAYYDKETERLRDLKISDAYEYEATSTGRIARRLKDLQDKTPLKSDYDAVSVMGESTIGSGIVYDLGENPSGYLRNNSSGARYMDQYYSSIAAPASIAYRDNFNNYATSKGLSRWKSTWDESVAAQFHREVTEEMAARLYDGNNGRVVNQAVKDHADALDAAYKKAGEVAKGRDGENPVLGFEDFKERSGYLPQVWSGRKFRDAIFNKLVTKEQLSEALFNSYRKIHLNARPEDLQLYAKALVTRFSANGSGIDTSVLSVLSHDGKPYLAQLLRDNGMSEKRIDKFLDAMTGSGQDKGKLGAAKQRLDIDPREAIPGTDMKIMDLMEDDVQKNFESYSRRISGASALARKGYQRTDIPWLKQAWEQENIAKGLKYDPKAFDGFMSYFTGGPIGGGVDPNIARIKRLTNLALLNGMGLPQIAEAGAIIGASGLEAFWKSMKTEVRVALQRQDSELTKQIASLGVVQGYDHLLHNAKFDMDMIRNNGIDQMDKLQFLDNALGTATKMQGYLSGFNAIKGMEQKVAVNSMVYKLHEMFKKGKLSAGNERRLTDIFGEDWKTFKKYFEDGTVKLTDTEIDLGLINWSVEHSEQFARGLNTHAKQVVQQAMAGESTYWMHKDMGSLLTHLKTFPLEAFQKQFVRNMRIMDDSAGLTFLYGLGLAGAVVMARNTLSNNGKEMDFLDVANGAFGLSNMTGWIPMWTDPIASMLGMDDARFNHYGASQASNGILSTPAFIPTLNRMAHIPGAAAKIVTGNGTPDDVYALQATPLIGNLYGFNAMFNSLKQGYKDDKKAEQKEMRKQKAEAKAVKKERKAKKAVKKQTKDPIVKKKEGILGALGVYEYDEKKTTAQEAAIAISKETGLFN